MRGYRVLSILLLVCFMIDIGCGTRNELPPDQPVATASADTQFKIETVASGLEVPWAFAWLPNKDLIFTERPGRVRIIEAGKLRPEPVFVVPDVEPPSESGLMDISLHPQFAANNFVYLAYAYNQDGKHIKVVRYKYTG